MEPPAVPRDRIQEDDQCSTSQVIGYFLQTSAETAVLKTVATVSRNPQEQCVVAAKLSRLEIPKLAYPVGCAIFGCGTGGARLAPVITLPLAPLWPSSRGQRTASPLKSSSSSQASLSLPIYYTDVFSFVLLQIRWALVRCFCF